MSPSFDNCIKSNLIIRAMTVVFMALLIMTSCQSQNESDLEYAAYNGNPDRYQANSLMTHINDTGSVDVAIAYKDSSDSNSTFKLPPEQEAQVKILIQKAANSWSNTLVGEKGWKLQENGVTVKFSQGINSQCARANGRWTCPGRNNNVSIIIDPSTPRSYAFPTSKLMVFGTASLLDSKTGALKSTAEKLIAHEFGHLWGLADTYSEAGKQTPIGQTSAMMNNFYKISGNDLRDDDVAGSRAIYNYMNNGEKICGDGYKSTAGNDKYNNQFCAKDESSAPKTVTPAAPKSAPATEQKAQPTYPSTYSEVETEKPEAGQVCSSVDVEASAQIENNSLASSICSSTCSGAGKVWNKNWTNDYGNSVCGCRPSSC